MALPYEAVRAQLARRSEVLDDVRVPRLCVLDVGEGGEGVLVGTVDGGVGGGDSKGEGKVEVEVKVTGLLGVGNVVFGDPMMAAWAEGASPAFWDGWGSCPVGFGRERGRVLL